MPTAVPAAAPRPAFLSRALAVFTLVLAVVLCGQAAAAPGDVTTSQVDDSRTGANLHETVLDAANVRPATFGRLFTYALDGPVFGQPLVVSDIEGSDGRRRRLVLFTTAVNTVYAYDTSGGPDSLVWRRSLDRLPGGNAAPPRGIMSTPVIDAATHTLYVVAGFMDGSRARFSLHALDLSDGTDRPGSPVAIEGAVTVESSRIAFAPTERRMAIQRAGLALSRGRVIVAFGGDFFEGWVFAFDTADLRAAPATFCTTCASRVSALSGTDYHDEHCTFLGPGGGIWQAGRAPAVDAAGQVFFFTANKAHIVNRGCLLPPSPNACSACRGDAPCRCEGVGTTPVCRGPDTCVANRSTDGRHFDTHDALIRLDPARGLALTGWFRPGNWNIAGPEGLEVNDLDLGSAGPALIPGTSRLLGAGKQGVMNLFNGASPEEPCTPAMDRTCLGPTGRGALQAFPIAPTPSPPNHYYRHVFVGPVVWARGENDGGALAYVWRENDVLRSYRLGDRFEDCRPVAPSPIGDWRCEAAATGEAFVAHHPGGILALSANGTDPGTGIVWVSAANAAGGGGRLMAYRAVPDETLPGRLEQLWSSDDCEADAVGTGSGFVPPTVAHGRAYFATQAGTVEVFGLIPPRECRRADPGQAPPTLRM